MPKYKNNTSSRIVAGGRTVEPGDSFSTLVWLDEASTGLTKVSDSPVDNPVYYSAKHSSDATILVPASDASGDRISKFRIRMHVVTGEVSVRFSVVGNDPPLLLYPGADLTIDCWERIIDSIILDFTVAGDMWVMIQRL